METKKKTARERNLQTLEELQNKLNAMNGQEPVGDDFIRRYDNSTGADLIREVRRMREAVEKASHEKTVREFFEGAGHELQLRVEKRKEECRMKFQQLYDGMEVLARENFKDTPWTVRSTFVQLYYAGIMVCMTDEEKGTPIFGTEITLRYDDKFFSEAEQFTANIGTAGKNDLLDTSKGSRTFFYIQLGELFKNQEKMRHINDVMATIVKEYRKTNDRLRNAKEVERDPFGNTLTDDED